MVHFEDADVNDDEGITQVTSESVEHQLMEDKYGELPKYDPLYYSRKEKASWFGVEGPFTEFNDTKKMKFSISVKDEPTNQTITIPELPLYHIKKLKMSTATGCNRHHGHFESTGNTCYIYSILSHACVQIDKDAGGKWYLNTNKLTKAFGCYSQYHNATSYTVIPLETGERIEDKMPYTMGDLTWEIRNAYDPLLLAEVLTEDTNNFGLSSTELRYLGIAMLFDEVDLLSNQYAGFITYAANSRKVRKAGGNRAMNYRDDYYDEYAVERHSGLQRGNPPIQNSIEPSADQGIDFRNDMDEIELEKGKVGATFNKSKLSHFPKRVKKKGEYESYYQ
eukprot:CAMPEP_0197008310 /NCGR_PEP_ID=MMETSP1380-20130617/44739_1 /TAXON_ID=5936 /ORGANISM="Euplotes crassus, Strain CT5" /LENGTH=335 /DNA_ID=CAMNT_0042428851 /DNA_START=219 /DNA_END=1226 /DNA_ORIENTATION=+